MYPQSATKDQNKEDEKTREEREKNQTKKEKGAKDRLTRDHDMVDNVACFVKVFGMGILPLMFNSAWRSAFPQFKTESIEPCHRQLNEREPALKAIADFVNANFYAYIQDRGRIPQRPVVGVGPKHRKRAGFTVMELFNRPQDLQQHKPVFNVFGDRTQGYRNSFMIKVARRTWE